MLSKTDLVKVYDTMMSAPGMKEPVKVTFKLARKDILVLAKILEQGDTIKTNDESIFKGNDIDIDLKSLATNLLEQAGLSDFNEKLQALT